MNSKDFVVNIQQRLDPLAPIVLPRIIQKQLQELGVTEETLTPEKATEFIEMMDRALEIFIGPKGKMMVHEIMMKELRRTAPEHFEKESLT